MSFKLVLFIVLSCVGFFGLAIIGAGGFHAYSSNAARVALLIIGVVMFVVSMFSQGNISSGEREDRGNRWVLLVFAVIAPLLCYVPAYTDRHGLLTVDGDTVRWIGVFLFTVGGALRIWPVFVLGRRFSGLVAIQPEHKLVTTGIYRIIRHPSYLGLLVNALGWVLTFRSGIGILISALLILPTIGRIHSEEKMLRSQFGDEYDDFCAKTPWRLIPWLY